MSKKINKKYKLSLNSVSKLQELLQEQYDEADRNIIEIQLEMNKLANSVELNNEIIEAKAKYAKAMNDFIASKDKAIGRKLEIAKLMSEIIKHNGDTKKAIESIELPEDWTAITEKIVNSPIVLEENNKTEKYYIK